MARDDLAHGIIARRRPKQHHDVTRFTRLDRHTHLKRAARIDRGADRPRQASALQRRRTRDRPVATEELAPISRIVGDSLTNRCKRDCLGELRIEVVSREHRLRRLVEAGANLILRQLTSNPKHPLQIPRQRQLLPHFRVVPQRQYADLHRVVLIDAHSQRGGQSLMGVIKHRVAGTVANPVWRRLVNR